MYWNLIIKTLILPIMSTVITKTLNVSSPAFTNNSSIPSKYTCDGKSINPELNIGNIPAEAKTLAIIVDDPDAPKGTFVHWVMWNIPVKEKILENSAPGFVGKNEKNENKYTGPCPPSGTHHYHFKIYALDTTLDLQGYSHKQDLLKAMEGHIIASGELIGTYKK
jgi:Raf kinase inhibitor-like YbhB/YbcL family protein